MYFCNVQQREQLLESQHEIERLQAERDQYEDNMKKAFMRGVCALNMEAMAMFNPDEEGSSHLPSLISAFN